MHADPGASRWVHASMGALCLSQGYIVKWITALYIILGCMQVDDAKSKGMFTVSSILTLKLHIMGPQGLSYPLIQCLFPLRRPVTPIIKLTLEF